MPSANNVVVETPPPNNKSVEVPIVEVVVGIVVRAPVAKSKVVMELPPPNTKAVVSPIVGVVDTTGVNVGTVGKSPKLAYNVGTVGTVGTIGATVGNVGKSPKEANNNVEEDIPGVE